MVILAAESIGTTCCLMAPSGTKALLASSQDLSVTSAEDRQSQLSRRSTRASSLAIPDHQASQISSRSSVTSEDLLKSTTDNAIVSQIVFDEWSSLIDIGHLIQIVCADDHSGLIRIYRNSALPREEERGSVNRASRRTSQMSQVTSTSSLR